MDQQLGEHGKLDFDKRRLNDSKTHLFEDCPFDEGYHILIVTYHLKEDIGCNENEYEYLELLLEF